MDKDLANLYKVSVGVLNQAVKRNMKRFPEDFKFQLTKQEVAALRSQFVILNREPVMAQEVSNPRSQNVTLKRGQHMKFLPYVFTEQGVAMLSSERAIQVNITIMRAFVKLKELILTHKDLAEKIAELEKKYENHDNKIQLIFEAIKKLLEPVPAPPEPKKPPIGFRRD